MNFHSCWSGRDFSDTDDYTLELFLAEKDLRFLFTSEKNEIKLHSRAGNKII